MLTDTHVHLDFSEFANDFAGVMQRAADADVKRMVSIGTSVASSERALALAGQYGNVWAAVGIHPNHAHKAEPGYEAELRQLAGQPRVAAIGEIGLDYYWLPSAVEQRGGTPEPVSLTEDEIKQRQEEVFRSLLDLAVETGLAVVIHQRAAWDETVAVLRDYVGRVRCVFHCFGESWERAEAILAMGHLISFTGIVTFKNAPLVQDAARRVAGDRFMVETDAPYLAPVPFRGKRCEPAFVRHTAEAIARLRGETLEDLAAGTERVANDFFRLR
jgi:TatD DNase family protein